MVSIREPKWTKPSVVEFDGDVARLHLGGKGDFVAILDAEDARNLPKVRWVANVSFKGFVYARSSGEPRIYLHRYLLDAPSHLMGDHINGDTLDNRRANLRLATPRGNAVNSRSKVGRRFKGVYFEPLCANTSPWIARILSGGAQIYREAFKTEKEAALAYDTAAKQIFGEFARLNFPVAEVTAPHAPEHEWSRVSCLRNTCRALRK